MSNKSDRIKAIRAGEAPPYAPALRAARYSPDARKRTRPQRLSFRNIWVRANQMMHLTAQRSKTNLPPRRARRAEAKIVYHSRKRASSQ